MAKKKVEKAEKEMTEAPETAEEPEEVAAPVIQTAELEVVTPISEEEVAITAVKPTALDSWKPKTSLGKKVKSREIGDIDDIIDKGAKILETEIIDALLPNLESDLLLIGQSKGKFGGGQRRIFKQTQKKTKEGNKPNFSTMAIVGNRDGYLGMGMGKAKETVPAREKALRNAKLNVIKIRRGCGSWECNCKAPHSLPYAIEGKIGSVIIRLIPAPKGTGLIVESECAKILAMAGIKDVWSQTSGKTKTRVNVLKACFEALKNTGKVKIRQEDIEALGIIEGKSMSTQKEDKSFFEEIKHEEQN